ncbi:MAG: hypothetical protein COW00_06500 [Bdellovibrio sp. CG12_big_fil_rev_8_21_14_0_65_39_13]|nr:MAG: hypothetical protein COW78_19035 [Bdellovibrio sp. CG22_combo_CG10-13_8_21_14_all_39_27]PIQ60871.1 MAG: hypothetical protein COW00_06500 [Bdellovibrio sp. CG12_big_fil_rev_8_21_14_0_65_39_13]PIR36495.1 MAG: hypothetical protein COV37_03845 [Bdellovibrio sp. CG11_big_fil_rev_8_21_14_0_20_39_38]PJB54157.1 MAG: hypothetical protein CO099_03110 [Bdellovibrio sp. CG_4_9_14_3_um_filter_39_7]
MTCNKMLFLIALLMSVSVSANDFQIYSIFHEIPMTNQQQVMIKNYYVNVGEESGVKDGTVMDVYRSLSVLDPYDTKRRYQHKVKVGELKIIHADQKSSIAIFHELKNGVDQPRLEVQNFMVGDVVKVKIN